MKSIGKIALFVFFLFCMFLLKPRQDVVFEAIDTTQYIRLFEEDRDFVLCLEENYAFTGTYSIEADTVFLNYRQVMHGSMAAQNFSRSARDKTLPGKLYIDEDASTIVSGDGFSFSAEISLDLRDKPHQGTAYRPSKSHNQGARILAFGGLKEASESP